MRPVSVAAGLPRRASRIHTHACMPRGLSAANPGSVLLWQGQHGKLFACCMRGHIKGSSSDMLVYSSMLPAVSIMKGSLLGNLHKL